MFSTSLEETLIIDMCFSQDWKSSQILNICLICKQTLKSSCVYSKPKCCPEPNSQKRFLILLL